MWGRRAPGRRLRSPFRAKARVRPAAAAARTREDGAAWPSPAEAGLEGGGAAGPQRRPCVWGGGGGKRRVAWPGLAWPPSPGAPWRAASGEPPGGAGEGTACRAVGAEAAARASP